LSSGRLALVRLLETMWLGGAIFLVTVAAPAAFKAAGGPSAAADVVGVMLNRWHYIALVIPVLLLLLNLRAGRPLVVALLTVVIFFAALQGMVDLRARSIRLSSAVPVSSLEPDHPVRRQFGRLHGMSMMLLAAQILGGIGIVAAGAYTSWREQMREAGAPGEVAQSAPSAHEAPGEAVTPVTTAEAPDFVDEAREEEERRESDSPPPVLPG
jgi:hypothetical protein